MSHTGYVYGLINDNLNFKQFASTCAYAFGALASYRDSDVDRTTLPDDSVVIEKLEEDSTLRYYKESLKEYTDKLNLLKSYTEEQKIEYGKSSIKEKLEYNKRELERELKEKKIVQDMLKKVEAWEPPTKDHVNFKSFMINQLNQSQFIDDYYQTVINNYSNITPLQIFNNEVRDLKEDIKRCKKRIKEESKKSQIKTCGDWVKQLKQSLENYD